MLVSKDNRHRWLRPASVMKNLHQPKGFPVGPKADRQPLTNEK